MKVIIAGGRDFNDYGLLQSACDQTLSQLETIEIVSGTSSGADKLGEKYANTNNYPIKKFPANWTKYGPSAGPIRNKQMAEYADALIVFWDGKSKGTNSMIKLAKKYNVKTVVIKYTPLI